MRETTQFTVSNRWKDRNMTRMLLTCEQLHDLGAILLDVNDNDDKDHTNDGNKFIGHHIFALIFMSFVVN